MADIKPTKPAARDPRDSQANPAEGEPTANGPSGAAANSAAASTAPTAEVAQRRFEFLFAPTFRPGIQPLSTGSIGQTLENLQDIKVLDRIKSTNVSPFATEDHAAAGDVVVAEMTMERALKLQATAGHQVVIERNWALQHLGIAPAFTQAGGISASVTAPVTNIQVQVLGKTGQPLARAMVMLSGHNFPVQGETDGNGMVSLPVYGSSTISIDAIYVKPFADFWETYIQHPSLLTDTVNTITLEPLSSFARSRFPSAPYFGWGQRIMGLNENTYQSCTGRGARVAIIDSGCDNQHPALRHIATGVDYTRTDANGTPDPNSWTTDTLSHGTHCAGVIAGNGQGIRGFAPEADVRVLKLFPNGRFDDLIRALKYCVENKIDVANCSLGSDQGSETVKLWLDLARQAGVAVVVAAGNSAGPVQFPALLSNVLSVSAIGQEGNFPADTYHQQTQPAALPGLVGVNGIFSPRFTCFGPQIRTCGPGVAIISSVPGGGYAAWDGTSMAAPHVTGLLALIAAHPAIASMPRDASRVDRMFQIAIASGSAIGLDSVHGGGGLPSIAAALQTNAQAPTAVPPALAPSIVPDIDAVVQAVLANMRATGALAAWS
jgi:subtilisin family serine protease